MTRHPTPDPLDILEQTHERVREWLAVEARNHPDDQWLQTTLRACRAALSETDNPRLLGAMEVLRQAARKEAPTIYRPS